MSAFFGERGAHSSRVLERRPFGAVVEGTMQHGGENHVHSAVFAAGKRPRTSLTVTLLFHNNASQLAGPLHCETMVVHTF